jgi:FtsP/CotA-like multicopper oxidase with cupredoxin domain
MAPGRSIDRRRFLLLSGGGGLALLAGCSSSDDPAGRPSTSRVTIGSQDPAVAAAEAARPASGTVARHELRAARVTLAVGQRDVDTWAFDGVVPGRELRVTEGDTLEVVVHNDLPEDTTIHWHGLALRNDMDGVHDLTQEPIRPGEAFTYRFVAPQPGTYWFHPHMGLQLDRALYAPLVIEARDEPGGYDVDQVVVLDDWLDGISGTPEEAFEMLTGMGMGREGTGHEGMGHDGEGGMGAMSRFRSDLLGGDAGDVDYPLHLINGRPSSDRPTIDVPAGGRIRLRFVNAGSDTAYRVAVGGQTMTVTHTDGFPVEPTEVDTLLIGMGERYDVLLAPTSGAWPLVALAEGKDLTATAVIRTSDAAGSAAPPVDARPAELDGRLLRYDDLVASEAVRLDVRAADVDEAIRLTGSMMPYSWAFDGAAFPDRPPIDVRQGQRVRLAFENATSMWHPIHLHGHTFRVGTTAAGPRKDTVNVLPGETVVVELDAGNPGQWMAHCHNTYHLERGMAMVVSYVP